MKDAFRAIAKDKGIGEKEFAFKLGVHLMNVSHWGNQEKIDRHMPAYLVPEICRVMEDFRLLDRLEEAAGRTGVIFVPHSFQHAGFEDVKVVQSLIKEVGEALQTLANTLEDGLVEDHEYEATICELNDVIHECAKLKQWLKDRLEADRPKVAETTAPAKR